MPLFCCGSKDADNLAMALAASAIDVAADPRALEAFPNAFVMDTSAWLIAMACGEPGLSVTGGGLWV